MTSVANVLPGVNQVQVSSPNNGQVLAFHLEWSDQTESREMNDANEFVDASGLAPESKRFGLGWNGRGMRWVESDTPPCL